MPANSSAYNLGQSLGQLVLGNPTAQQKAYMQGQALGSLVNNRMADAAKARADALLGQQKYTARQQYDPTAFLDPNATLAQRAEAQRLAAVGDLATQASAAMDTYSKGRTEQRRDLAQEDFQNGNTLLGNLALAVADGKPIQTTTDTGGELYNQYASPNQAPTVTPLGDATIGKDRAAAMASRAAAGESAAHARLLDTQTAAGGFNPHAGGDPTKPSEPPLSQLGTLLGQGYDPKTGLVSAPQERMQQFLAWQAAKAATDPRYNNGAFALQHYATEAPLGAGINDSPAAVGALPLGNLVHGSSAQGGLGDLTMGRTGTRAPRSPPPAGKKTSAPHVGVVENGYVFKGGDPSRKESWVKVSDLQSQVVQ